jgi:hypothetical protein
LCTLIALHIQLTQAASLLLAQPAVMAVTVQLTVINIKGQKRMLASKG